MGEFQIDTVETWEVLKENLSAKLKEYNETNIVMDLVLFKDAMIHVCRIMRILY
jgi:fructose-bisphosphate aldolase class 1